MKENRAIVTTTVGDFYQKVAEHSHPLLKKYADRCNADFIVFDEHNGFICASYKKLDIKKLLEKTYDRVLYLDTDILVTPNAPNLFDAVPTEYLAAFNEGSYLDRKDAKARFDSNPEWVNDPKYFNAGVMLVPKKYAGLYEPPEPQVNNFYEQTFLNHQFFTYKVPVWELNYRFNLMASYSAEFKVDPLSGYFIHYAGFFSSGNNEEALKQFEKEAIFLTGFKVSND